MNRIKHADLALALTDGQLGEVARMVSLSLHKIDKVYQAINDVLLGDPIGTIRRSHDGYWLALRVSSVNHPYETICISGRGGSCPSDPNLSALRWPIIFTPGGLA